MWMDASTAQHSTGYSRTLARARPWQDGRVGRVIRSHNSIYIKHNVPRRDAYEPAAVSGHPATSFGSDGTPLTVHMARE